MLLSKWKKMVDHHDQAQGHDIVNNKICENQCISFTDSTCNESNACGIIEMTFPDHETTRNYAHHFRGCDASVLIATKPGSKTLAEKDADDNKDLRTEGFDTIMRAKTLVESKCPGVVSCADILAIAARDFVHLAGGPYYQVKKGRWDGKISMASRVTYNLPRANSTVDRLIELFSSKGLTVQDLVVLSGAHTIGFAHCKHFVGRLYDYKGTKQPDPSIDPRLLKALKMSCPQVGGNADIVAPFDVTTPFLFDHAYYANLEAKLGLLASDQGLFLDPKTKPLVQALGQDKAKFFQAFAEAMDKMGLIGVKRGRRHGEKRIDCSMHM
ncbi:peroxidase 19-like [Durio zibethinus]|uniref:Peroxidase n=1 Tax=Durio zibethinus TaxID=66656 RepID=A0A6P5WY66_DURZI|nr:peroxidase 19-like [Durio zibethinus]